MMKPFVRLMSVALVIVCLSASAEIVRWEFPRIGNCHEGIPFSDGRTGVLVWGGGETVNLTIGRSDLWDHRGGYPWTDEQNYTNIIEAVRTRDNARLQTLFRNDPPPGWGGRYNPYMLPLGRVVVTIPGVELVSGSLDPFTGLGTLSFLKDGTLQTAELAMCRWGGGLFAIRFPEGVPFSADVLPAMAHAAVKKALAPRGFTEPDAWRTTPGPFGHGTSGGFVWKLPTDDPVQVFWWQEGRELLVRSSRSDLRGIGAWSGPAPAFEIVCDFSVSHWRTFWEKGVRVQLPDPVLQRVFEYGMYRFGAMTDPSGVPAGLQGPWLEDDKLVPWNGDYHFNINVQECYAPAFRGGHFDHLLPLFRMVLGWRERLRDNAKKFVGIDNGYTLPHSVDDRGVCIGGFWTGTIDHGSTAWVASMMFRYVKYSGDVTFLRDGAYDFMKGAMNVYRAMMQERDGRLSIPLAPSPEWGASDVQKAVGRDSSFQLAAAHRLARDLQTAAKMLGEAPDPMWMDVDARLPAYTADASGICLFEGQRFVESHRHHSHMAALFPFDTLDLNDPETRQVAARTYGTWVECGTGKWSGWCVPWASVLNVHMGAPERAVDLLHAWDAYYCDEGYGSHHNAVRPGFTAWLGGRGIMQMDGQCAATAAVLELLAHETNGQVEFFKGCPDRWKEVSFENLRLSDGRRVSGRRVNGKVTITAP